jgi:flagellar hook-length control protein FliK
MPIIDEKVTMTMARETGTKQETNPRVDMNRAVQTERHEQNIQGRLYAEPAVAKPGGQSGLPQHQVSNAFPTQPPIVTGAPELISIGALAGRAYEPINETSQTPPTSQASENPMPLLSRVQNGFHNTVVLQLQPPELGHVVVHVHRGHEQLNALFWVESSEARSLLQAHLPALQDALTRLGLPNQQITLQVVSDDALGQLFSQSAYQQQPSPGYSSHDQGRRHGSQRNHLSFVDSQKMDEDYQRFVDIFI